jgi:hypothetical protein
MHVSLFTDIAFRNQFSSSEVSVNLKAIKMVAPSQTLPDFFWELCKVSAANLTAA